MTIGELSYSLGAEWDKGSLDNIENGFAQVSASFISAIGLASASMAGTFGAVKEFASFNDELGKMARNRDVAVGFLQTLEYQLDSAGLSGSMAGDMLAKLQEQKEGFKTGKADFEAFDRIGINPNAYSDTESYFKAVVDGLNGISDEATKANLANRILGSSDLANFLDGGSEAIEKQKAELKELGILVNDQDYRSSADFNDTLLKTTTILKGLANKVMTSIMPIFIELMAQFNTFIKANKELISSDLKAFLDALIDGSKFFLSLIGRVVEHLGGLKTVIAVIAGLLVIWQLPLIATIGLIVALMLAFDDVMNFFNGNESVIGGWIKTLEKEFTGLFAYFGILRDHIFNVWDLITGKISFKEAFDQNLEIMERFLSLIKTQFLSFANWIKDLFKNLDIFDGMGNQIEGFKKHFSDFIPDVPSWFGGGSDPVAPVARAQAQAIGSSSTQTTNHYNINAQVNATNKTVAEAIDEITPSEGYN
jgi:hypothetical protein